jgi:hypothetical protein
MVLARNKDYADLAERFGPLNLALIKVIIIEN